MIFRRDDFSLNYNLLLWAETVYARQLYEIHLLSCAQLNYQFDFNESLMKMRLVLGWVIRVGTRIQTRLHALHTLFLELIITM